MLLPLGHDGLFLAAASAALNLSIARTPACTLAGRANLRPFAQKVCDLLSHEITAPAGNLQNVTGATHRFLHVEPSNKISVFCICRGFLGVAGHDRNGACVTNTSPGHILQPLHETF